MYRRGRSRSRARSRSRSRNRGVGVARSPFGSRLTTNPQNKDVTILKTESILGITLSDGDDGFTCIRRIRPGSACSRLSDQIRLGSHILGVNGVPMHGKRHFQVATLLRSIPIGQLVTLTLRQPPPTALSLPCDLEPTSVVQPEVCHQGEAEQKPDVQAAKAPVELESGVEVQDGAPSKKLIERINRVFEEYLGVNDDDLAVSVWSLVSDCNDLLAMSARIRESDHLSPFNFPEELVFDIWGILDDHKNGRLKEERTNDAREEEPQKSVHPTASDDEE